MPLFARLPHTLLPCLLCCLFLPGLGQAQDTVPDSALTREQAIFANQPPGVPSDVQARLAVVDVRYLGFDGRVHQGQVVIHAALANDLRALFQAMLDSGFPLESVLPIAHPLIQENGPYGISPDTNNTSGWVWRPSVGMGRLSLHALGLAVDINPRLNPYVRGETVLPPGATYDPTVPGTLAPDGPVVRAFKALGWSWGGDWSKGTKDYMHFQKVPHGLEPWVRSHR